MKLKEDNIMLFCAIISLPLMLLMLPAMLIARFGRPKRDVKIALTVSNRWGTYLQYMRLPYDLAILRAGAKVVTIAPSSIKHVGKLLDKVDGVIISGGEDIASEDNGKSKSTKVNITRDALERTVLKEAKKRELPVLCICRGMQLLSLDHGGVINCHDDDKEMSAMHKTTLNNLGRHSVEIAQNSKLYKILNREKIKVNSFHHQHITDPGDLIISAKSPDGLIEAVEMDSDRFCIGVQWHPELLALFDYKEELLFKTLVDNAVKRKEIQIRKKLNQ